jgi:hypothetical protein
MRIKAKPAVLMMCVAIVLGTTSTSLAQDFYRQHLVSWPDPLTPPRVTMRCVKEASTSGVKCRGLKCRRTTWRTCVGHAYDTQHMQCELFLRVPRLSNLPRGLENSARNVAEVCGAFAASTCGAVAVGTTPAAALACLKPAFLSCLRSRGGQALAALSVTVEQSCGWHR